MSSRFSTPEAPNAFLEHRRAEVERDATSAAQYFKVYGEIQVFGTGESNADIIFPVRFVNKPIPHFGSEVAWGSTFTDGQYPTCVVSILTWDTQGRPDGSAVYVGAYLGIVTNGVPGQLMNVHWSVEGIGLRNPSSAQDLT